MKKWQKKYQLNWKKKKKCLIWITINVNWQKNSKTEKPMTYHKMAQLRWSQFRIHETTSEHTDLKNLRILL